MKISAQARIWLVVAVFAVAMAWLEAATVYYLRVLVDRLVPYQTDPLPIRGTLGPVELVREAATLVMLLTVGMLAGRTWQARLGYAAIAFGIWDIFYYVFLKVIYDWPTSFFEWDILFLLPLPWWGPVIAPVTIALLMMIWGTMATQAEDDTAEPGSVWVLASTGIALALGVFMIDAWRALPQGRDAILQVLPTRFNWVPFWVAALLMASPVLYRIALLRAKTSVPRGTARVTGIDIQT